MGIGIMHFDLDFEFSGGEVEGLVFEAKGGDQVVEGCDTVPGCYEFSASRASREARFWAEAGQTGYSSSATAGFFSNRSASNPCGGPCRGTHNLHPCMYDIELLSFVTQMQVIEIRYWLVMFFYWIASSFYLK